MTRTAEERLTVFYDGSCPLCRREIRFYRERTGAGQLAWVDVSRVEGRQVAEGLSRDMALARFHVRMADGRLLAGGDAFAALWSALPRFAPIGRMFRFRPLRWLLNRSYDAFLGIRPSLQALIAAKGRIQ
ncbi:MAG: DUF393 domain-containing protein [Pseudomonadota bacterium]